MIDLNLLETFRTKEELINYFEKNGKNITEEEIEALKKNYEQAEQSSNNLTLNQLDDVAGGFFFSVHQGKNYANLHCDIPSKKGFSYISQSVNRGKQFVFHRNLGEAVTVLSCEDMGSGNFKLMSQQVMGKDADAYFDLRDDVALLHNCYNNSYFVLPLKNLSVFMDRTYFLSREKEIVFLEDSEINKLLLNSKLVNPSKSENFKFVDENGVEQTITKVLTKELMENVKTQVEELSLTRDESSHLSHLLNYYDQLVKNLS